MHEGPTENRLGELGYLYKYYYYYYYYYYIPVSLGGEHILLVRCVSWVLDLISLRICFAQGGEHISLGIGEPC